MSDIKEESANSKSNNQGRAYEYAWIIALNNKISEMRKTEIVHNSSWEANERAWNSLSEDMQKVYEKSAASAIDLVVELEPIMIEDDGDILTLEFQRDEAGKNGDVRDILVIRGSINWEIGLSIKHNHDAVKHSRLSHKLDFGKEWYKIPCSSDYWDEIKPIFDRLIRDKENKLNWPDLTDKETGVYIPLLDAFVNEVNRAYAVDHTLARRMVEYLIGMKDYYKVVSHDDERLTLVHTYNLHGELNKPSKSKKSSICVPLVILPTEMVALKRREGCTNYVDMYLNNGWQLSFRIHNASTKVEPSLKFDIQFVGMPVSVLHLECKWN